jgi:hypothetical protein
MKGLYRYLSPFTPDQSGAVSVLFELGGLVIICDAGGCAGNICGFDEPRFQTKKSAVFSACLRDMDAILGRDDKLIAKTGDALVSYPDAQFVAYIGTPVPAVIGTDFHALRRMAEKKFNLPVIAVDTNGMENYDRGEEKAYRALIDTFAGTKENGVPFAGIWGATPLELAAPDSAALLRAQCPGKKLRVVTYGMDSLLGDVQHCGDAEINYAVSPAGLSAARYLEQKYGTPYKVLPPFSAQNPAYIPDLHGVVGSGPVLVVHQQFMANGVRDAVREKCSCTGIPVPQVDVGTFFSFVSEYAETGDTAVAGEDEFIALVRERGYRTIIADPLFRRALPDFTGTFIPLPHFAVSGQLYAVGR